MLELNLKRKRTLQAALIALSAGSASIAHGEDYAAVPAAAAALNTAPVTQVQKAYNGAHPDISALRYYAVRGEQERVQSEIDRLRTLYPSWQQPENIFAEDDGQESGLWKLYGDGQYEKLKIEIERLQKEVVGYSPSIELQAKLEQSEYRSEIAKAAIAKNWDVVIDKTNKKPALLLSDDVEVIWFLAEAYAHKERPDDAFEAYEAALKVAKTEDERRATIDKASIVLPSEKVLALVETLPVEKRDPKLIQAVNDSIVRGALSRSAELGEQAPETLNQRMMEFANRVRVEKNEADAVLLAWSNFGQRNWKGASDWFEFALSVKETPKAVEGAIMSSMRLNNFDRASQLAGRFLHESDEIGALFISVHAKELLRDKPRPMSTEFLQTYAEKTAQLNNGEGSEALGWYAFNIKQLQAAQAWFQKAMLWDETETAVFGLAMTASRMKDASTFNALKQTYSAKYPKVAALKYTVESRRKRRVTVKRRSPKVSRAGNLRGRIAKLYNAKQFTKCLEMSRGLRKYGPLNANDLQMRGWCLMGAKRPSEAERAFAASVRLGGKTKTPSAYGQALAALQSGKTNQALAIANSNHLTKSQRRVVDVELLTQRARAAFKNKDYSATIYALDKRAMLKTETRDLTFMRAWSHYNTGQYENAREIFSLLDQQLSTHDSQKGMNAAKLKIYRSASNEH